MTSGTPRRRRADAARNAERIARALREVVATGGPGVSLEEVARHAGVGVATLYRHYPDRTGLVRSAIRMALDEALGSVPPRADGTDDARRELLDDLDAVLVFADRERALLAAASDAGVLAGVLGEVVVGDLQRSLQVAVDQGRVRGDLVPDDVPRLLVMVLSVLTTTTPGTGGWRRYSTLLADALAPTATTPLPAAPAVVPPEAGRRPGRTSSTG